MSPLSILILGLGFTGAGVLVSLAWKIWRTNPEDYRRLHMRTGSLSSAIFGQVRPLPGPGPDPVVVRGTEYNYRKNRFEVGAKISDDALDGIGR